MLPYSLVIAQDSGKIYHLLCYVFTGDLGAEVTQLQGTETTGNGGAAYSVGHPGVEQFMMEPTFKRSVFCF